MPEASVIPSAPLVPIPCGLMYRGEPLYQVLNRTLAMQDAS
jgi:hypothetical protein